MIENRKVYNIKIYNNEVNIIITVLTERIRQLRSKLEEEKDEMQKIFIKSDIQKYQNIITRLDTGIIYNDEQYLIDNIDNNIEEII